jgi:hypothetical protein
VNLPNHEAWLTGLAKNYGIDDRERLALTIEIAHAVYEGTHDPHRGSDTLDALEKALTTTVALLLAEPNLGLLCEQLARGDFGENGGELAQQERLYVLANTLERIRGIAQRAREGNRIPANRPRADDLHALVWVLRHYWESLGRKFEWSWTKTHRAGSAGQLPKKPVMKFVWDVVENIDHTRLRDLHGATKVVAYEKPPSRK